MNGNGRRRGPADSEPPHDAWLHAALRHAPDADEAPPADVDAVIRAAAVRAADEARRTHGRDRSPPPRASAAAGWHRLWAALARPQVATGFAGVMVAVLVGVMWHDRPLDEALPRAPEPVAPRSPAVSSPPSPAVQAAPNPVPNAAPKPAPTAAPPAPPPAAEAAREESGNAAKAESAGRADAQVHAAQGERRAAARDRAADAAATRLAKSADPDARRPGSESERPGPDAQRPGSEAQRPGSEAQHPRQENRAAVAEGAARPPAAFTPAPAEQAAATPPPAAAALPQPAPAPAPAAPAAAAAVEPRQESQRARSSGEVAPLARRAAPAAAPSPVAAPPFEVLRDSTGWTRDVPGARARRVPVDDAFGAWLGALRQAASGRWTRAGADAAADIGAATSDPFAGDALVLRLFRDGAPAVVLEVGSSVLRWREGGATWQAELDASTLATLRQRLPAPR